jgi:two-component system LytT family response regulator
MVILDVEMPGMTGVECARAIQDQNPRTMIIFVTAHEQYMSDAFSVYAFDYLLKPFRLERVDETLRLARMRLTAPMECPAPVPLESKPVLPAKAAPTRLMLRHRDGVSFIDLDHRALHPGQPAVRDQRHHVGARRAAAGEHVLPHPQVLHREPGPH